MSGGEFVVIPQRDYDVEVDAVEQGPGDALALLFDLADGAAAFAFGISVVAARGWVTFWLTPG